MATVAICTPIFLGVIIPGPWFVRHQDNPQVKAFVRGATAAAAGAIAGATVVLARGAIVAEGPPGTLRGTTDRIRIEVNDVVAARSVLERLGGSDTTRTAATSGPGVMEVTLSDGLGAADVNAALVRGGIRVHALEPQRDTLEDVFLHLVEGIDVPR